MKPIIGITVAHVDEEIKTYPREYYVKAVLKAGGIPLLLPVVAESDVQEQYINTINGLILSGGSDVAPAFFGQEPLRGVGRVYAERDMCELELTRRAIDNNLPVLGICRGAQVLNIAVGGDIYQDICSQMAAVLDHNQKADRAMPWHSVNLRPGSMLSKLLDCKEIRVNSFHHQAIKTVAPGFKIAAQANDGVIEAIESLKEKFVLGVQWHPEAMCEDKYSARLFDALVKACMETN